MEFSPKTASKTWNMAKQLAKSMHMISSGENSIEDSSEWQGVEFLVHLGQILAKSVSGRQDVDTTNCEWNDLPTIPTEKEILSGKVIHFLSLKQKLLVITDILIKHITECLISNTVMIVSLFFLN
jgi:hypothetical protein